MDKHNNSEIQKKEIRKKLGLPPKNPATNSSKNKEKIPIPPHRFYTAQEEVTIRFYQVPKSLFNNPKYKGLSLGPKLMYSILRDRLDLSIKNDWKDEKGYIYLIFSVEELSNILDAGVRSVIRYKKILIEYELIYEKRLGQGKPNWIYILKPELNKNQKCQNGISRNANKSLLEVPKSHPNDTYVNHTNLNNVNNAISNNRKKRSPEKESLANYIAEQLEDDHSLGFYRKIVDLIPEDTIYIVLSEVKDTHLTGKIKKSKAALFNSVIQAKAEENNIDLNIKKTIN
jgi:hypothetical protein